MRQKPCPSHKKASKVKTPETPFKCIMCEWYKNPTNVDILVGRDEE